jgi:multicomponent Na+:H+ antiporter subunit C
MTSLDLYTVAGALIFALGLHAVLVRGHLFWKVLAINVMGTGIFLVLLAAPARSTPGVADPVPQAMVLTGIVVAVAATALALGVALRVTARTGAPFLPDPDDDREGGG